MVILFSFRVISSISKCYVKNWKAKNEVGMIMVETMTLKSNQTFIFTKFIITRCPAVALWNWVPAVIVYLASAETDTLDSSRPTWTGLSRTL